MFSVSHTCRNSNINEGKIRKLEKRKIMIMAENMKMKKPHTPLGKRISR